MEANKKVTFTAPKVIWLNIIVKNRLRCRLSLHPRRFFMLFCFYFTFISDDDGKKEEVQLPLAPSFLLPPFCEQACHTVLRFAAGSPA